MFDIKGYSLKKQQKRKPVCTICKRGFKDWVSQAEHWKKKHRVHDSYTCKEWKREMGSLNSYRKHVLLYIKEKNAFAMSVDPGLHILHSLKSTWMCTNLNKKHVCQTRTCLEVFFHKETLKMHLKKHDQKVCKCPLCDHITDMDYYLKDCVTRMHGPIHVCDYTLNGCTYTLRHRSTMTAHEVWCEYKPSSSFDNNEDDKEGEEEGGVGRIRGGAIKVDLCLVLCCCKKSTPFIICNLFLLMKFLPEKKYQKQYE